MKNIKINIEIKGALEGTTGYVEIASTIIRPHVSELLEDRHDQNTLSPIYASLFAYRDPSFDCLSVIHIQGQHNGDHGRSYDTRIFYDIDADSIRKCDFKIGAIINSLPKMDKYRYDKIGQLDGSLQLKEINGYDKSIALNLAEQIMNAIANLEYLLIRIDNNFEWKENKVLENEVAKTLFAAIDMLPAELRPLASFALSIDEKYKNEFLYDKLIIIYHGNKNDFGFHKKIQIEWSDLNLKFGTNYLNKSELYTKSARKLMEGATDFFATDLSLIKILQYFQQNPPTDSIDLLNNPYTDAVKLHEIKLHELSISLLKKFRVLFSDFEHQFKQLSLEVYGELPEEQKTKPSILKRISEYVIKRNIAAFLVMAALIIGFGSGYITSTHINASASKLTPAPTAPAPVQPTLDIEVTYKIKEGNDKIEKSIIINPEWLQMTWVQMLTKELVSFKINGKPFTCKTKKIDGPSTVNDFYDEIKKAQQ